MKCFIINYNRLDLMKNMADYLASNNIEVYIIDNNSDYLPLLEYYEETHHCVIKMKKNYGYTVFWDQNIYEKLNLNERYILTDSDLKINHIPNDFLNVLNEGLDRYKNYDKCGFSLDIDDLPNNNLTTQVKNWEMKYWLTPLDNLYYEANIDTTFALYRVNHHSYSGIRTNKPYCAKHMPWYYESINDLSLDEIHYFKSLNKSTHWSSIINNFLDKNKIHI